MNKEKIKLLNNSNKNLAKKFYKDLSYIVKEGKEKQEVYVDFLNMLYDCQTQNIPSEEIIPNYSEFLEATVCSLDKRNKIEKFVIKHKNLLTFFASIILLFAIAYCSLSFSGAIGVWSKGIEYISESNKYSYTSKKIEFNEDIDLDLKDTNQNIGKIIYDDGINKFYIDDVLSFYVANDEGKIILYTCKIILSSKGVAKYKIGSIISDRKYDNDFDILESANIKYSIAGKEYTSYNSYTSFTDFKTDLFFEFNISIGILNGILSEAEEAQLQALIALDSITISLSEMYLSEWIRR